jgi:hypothetical protein
MTAMDHVMDAVILEIRGITYNFKSPLRKAATMITPLLQVLPPVVAEQQFLKRGCLLKSVFFDARKNCAERDFTFALIN